VCVDGPGGSYYYHAVTRATSWERPSGPNVLIMPEADIASLRERTAALAAGPARTPVGSSA
jgi:transcription elongation regulator 1